MKAKLLIITLALLISLIPVSKSIGAHEASIGQLVSAHSLTEPISQLKTKPIEPKVAKGTTSKPKAPQKPSKSVKHSCGDNEYARKIYQQESGCSLISVNSIGCTGLGQSCPGSKLARACPNWRTDYDCQNRFFTSHANEYGGWKQAYDFKYCTGSCYSARINKTISKGDIWW